MSITIHAGDCRTVLASLPADSFDSIVSDPPYGLHFMGKAWDKFAKPYDLRCGRASAAGDYDPRRDDEFQAFMREVSAALLRVAKPGAYMLMFGSPRRYHRLASGIEDAGWEIQDCLMWLFGSGFPKHRSKLKPAYEPIILASKPAPRATPLQIDACRLPVSDHDPNHRGPARDLQGIGYAGGGTRLERPSTLASGRWPANLLLDEDAAALLDEQSGPSVSGVAVQRNGGGQRSYSGSTAGPRPDVGYGDSGGASRFFYVAKASRSERGEGNDHPTVKPLALMAWLVKLITPPGGRILDPFAGSGTTGIAADRHGHDCTLIDLHPEYARLALERSRKDAPLFVDARIVDGDLH